MYWELDEDDFMINTVMILWNDYRRGLDWWLDLLTNYTLTTRDYTLQIADTHRLVFSVC
jgi:hypothetical protein